MNLTGVQLYSKATRNLRSVKRISEKDIDQQFKLTFIYPMLFDKRLRKFEDTMRNFIAVSMLKEIFVSNALNIVAMASKNFSLTDEHGGETDVQTRISKSALGQGGGGGYWQTDYRESAPQQIDQYKLQEKIKEKTAVIKQYLATEPRVKKLNPFVELITLDNLIDVPVIVGTKGYSIDSLTLAYILTTAIALKKPIGGPQGEVNIQYIINVIKRLKEDEAWNLLANMSKFEAGKKTPAHERLIAWLAPDHPKISEALQSFGRSVKRRYENIIGDRVKSVKTWKERWVNPRIPSRVPSSIKGQIDPEDFYKPGKEGVPTEIPEKMPQDSFKAAKEFGILDVVQDNLKEADLFFKFMLNDDLLRSQFGLRKEPGQISEAVKRVSGKAGELQDLVIHNFSAYLGYNINMYMKSFFNTIYPQESIVNYQKAKEKIFDKDLLEVLTVITSNIFAAIQNAFAGSTIDEQRAKVMKNICKNSLDDSIQKVEDRTNQLRGVRIGTSRFTLEQFGHFSSVSTDIGQEFDSLHQGLRHQLSLVIDNPTPIFNSVEQAIDNAVDEMLRVHTNEYRDDADGIPVNMALYRQGVFDNIENRDQIKNAIAAYLDETKSYIIGFIRTLFYISTMGSLCQYVNYVDIEIETTANDALDLPNYTLVLPLETIVMLHSAVVSKSWRHLVSKGITEGLNITDNYVKGIVKFINKRLDVPNLIVIDSKRGQVYYKLQYMTQINKSNLRTFETYIENMTKNELERRF